MAFNTHPFDLPHHPAELESKPAHNIFDDLESNLIDTSMLSPATTERKDSFTTSSTTYFSTPSSTNPWGDDTYSLNASSTSTSHPERHMSMSSHFADPVIGSNNPFLQHHPQYNWAVYDRSDSKTPISASTYEPFNDDFDAATTASFQPSVSTASAFGGAMPLLNNVRPSAIMPPAAGATPLTASPPPQSSKEWMSMAEQDLDNTRLPKRLRQSSPPRSLTPGFARRDGVRKKNARFDIPEGRSLLNIDDLIAKAATEEDVKELKQQKRLLRNRQAALDSRQRKKKHTEELEREQKAWHEHRSDLETKYQTIEEQLAALRMHAEQIDQERQELLSQVHSLTHEKETLVEQHTIETGELRKKISILTDRLESPITVPSQPPTEFADLPIELDQLNMSDWDNYIMVDEPEQKAPENATATSLVIGKARKLASSDDSQRAAGGWLLLFCLYGAWVVSNNYGSGAPQIPGVTEDIRAASAHIVQDILKGDDLPQPSSIISAVSGSTRVQPTPSMPAWIQPDANDKSNSMNTQFFGSNQASNMETLANSILAPSKDAEAESAFAMTAARYNSLTSTDFGSRDAFADEEQPSSPPIGHRKGLIESLRRMKEEDRSGSVAEVYTRSLLWSRIPEHVLHDFRRMVKEGEASKDDVKNEVMT